MSTVQQRGIALDLSAVTAILSVAFPDAAAAPEVVKLALRNAAEDARVPVRQDRAPGWCLNLKPAGLIPAPSHPGRRVAREVVRAMLMGDVVDMRAPASHSFPAAKRNPMPPRTSIIAASILASLSAAEARQSTLNMSCGQAAAHVRTFGAVVLSTGRHTFDRYVASPVFCPHATYAVAAWAPTRDGRCRIGYICQPGRHPWIEDGVIR